MHNKVTIVDKNGDQQTAQAPVIISASRSTDIPALYTEWFINRVKTGYAVWVNPFNQKKSYISFENCRVVVFWTKNPKPLIPSLSELDKLGLHYYFQYTLNDYENEGFEPNVPPLISRIETFKHLSDQVGKEKVIWRFDPILLTPTIKPSDILNRISNIGNQLKGYTDKLVFSFVDITDYRKVQNNLVKETEHFSKETISDAEPTHSDMKELASGLKEISEKWAMDGWKISLATCAEDIELRKYGIKHNQCIDGELMKRIFSQDADLMSFLNYGKLPERNTLFQGETHMKPLEPNKLKDKGQRKMCGCILSKDIGMYNTCSHFCAYCYANTSRSIVTKNRENHSETGESIIG